MRPDLPQDQLIERLVDTIETSSPLLAPTPSLEESSQEEIDELLLESPPGTSYIRDLLDAQMSRCAFRSKASI